MTPPGTGAPTGALPGAVRMPRHSPAPKPHRPRSIAARHRVLHAAPRVLPRSCLIVRSRCGRARWSAATARGGSPPSRLAPPRAIRLWRLATAVRGLASRPTAALRLWGAIDGALPRATAPPPDRAYDFLRNSGTISITFAHSASGSAEISAIMFSSCRQSGSYSYSS